MWIFRSGLVVAAYIGMNIYAGIRIFGFFRYFLPFFRAYVYWPLYFLFSFSYILIFLLRIDRVPLLRNIAMLSLPSMVYFFLAIVLADAFRLALQIAGRLPKTSGLSVLFTGIALGIALITVVYGSFNARQIGVVHYKIDLGAAEADASAAAPETGKSPLRMAMVSDIHIGPTVDRKWLAKVVDAINSSEPDIICLAGDIFDNNVASLREPEAFAAEFQRLKAPLGVYACQGNHDVDRLSLRGEATTSRTKEFYRGAGVVLLEDEVVDIEGLFYLAGRRDSRPIGARQGRKTAAELTAGLDLSIPLIVLDHQPLDFAAEEAAGADLILSGHTHRGQFFPGNLVTSRMYKKAGAVHYGYWRGSTAQAVVSSGAGVWGPPLRVATWSEVAVIEITFTP